MTVSILIGDCRDVLRTLPAESVHCCVTSPPYWGLRDYGNGAVGIGLEETAAEHMDALTSVFGEVRRVLRSDGTLWLNYGDAYAGSWGAQGRGDKRSEMEIGGRIAGENRKTLSENQIIAHPKRRQTGSLIRTGGCKAKDLMGLPWMLAFALRADGWWLRQDIIWAKPNPMPESVTDRCTKAHEYLFLLSKSERYRFDSAAIAEPVTFDRARGSGPMSAPGTGRRDAAVNGDYRKRSGNKERKPASARVPIDTDGQTNGAVAGSIPWEGTTRNKRSVWTVGTEPFPDAHFATFPPSLIEPCILAGCPKGGTILDPFGGAGTTGLVADRLQRNAILIELNPAYAAMARRRIDGDAPLFAGAAE